MQSHRRAPDNALPSATATNPTSPVISGLFLVLTAVTLYSLAHAGMRLAISPVLGEDDVMEAIFAQQWQVAYDMCPRQPPLYNWVIYYVQQIMGPGLASYLVVKYAALIITAACLYLAAYQALQNRLFALLSVEALALIYQIAWRYHEGFTHEVLAMALTMATVATVFYMASAQSHSVSVQATLSTVDMVRTEDIRSDVQGATSAQTWLAFIGLGVLLGLGLLTEPTFAVFFACLAFAIASEPRLRSSLLRPPLALSLVIALLMAAPYLLWIISEPARVGAWSRLIQPDLIATLDNALAALRGPFAYLFPLILIMPLVFPGFIRRAGADVLLACRFGSFSTHHPPDPALSIATGATAKIKPTISPDRLPSALELLSLRIGLFAFISSLAGAFALGISAPAVHVLMPLYLPMVIWLFGAAKRAQATPLTITRFTRIAVAIAAVAFVARAANLVVLDPVCKTCRWGIPYAALADELRSLGVRDDATILTVSKELAGNLRVEFPNASIVSRLYPTFTPATARPVGSDTVFIWPANHKKLPVAHIRKALQPELPANRSFDDAREITVGWSHFWRVEGYRTTTWRVLLPD
ncbi:MAG: hypothetical protein AAGG72_04500 [Pseudomonadota bacterium]